MQLHDDMFNLDSNYCCSNELSLVVTVDDKSPVVCLNMVILHRPNINNRQSEQHVHILTILNLLP